MFGCGLYTPNDALNIFGGPLDPRTSRRSSNDWGSGYNGCTSLFKKVRLIGDEHVQTFLFLQRRKESIAPTIRANARRLRMTTDEQEETSGDGGRATMDWMGNN